MRNKGLAVGALALLAGLAAVGRADDRAKASGELKPGAEYAAWGTIAEAPSATAKVLAISAGKGVTISLALGGRFELRVDKVVRPGKDGASALAKGAPVAVLGRPAHMAPGPGAAFRCRVTPTIVVVGQGFAPYGADMPPANPTFAPGELKWFVGSIDRFEAPAAIWIGKAGDCQVPLGASGRFLATTVGDGSKLLESPDLGKLLEKGRPVRFKGKVEDVACADAKGQPVPPTARGKPGVTTEARLTPKRLLVLDAGWPSYEAMEAVEEN